MAAIFTIGEQDIIEWELESTNMNRRVSCPNPFKSVNPNDKENATRHRVPLRNSRSLDSSPDPRLKMGIPLGSLTARLASKSFWNSDMLKRSMDEIAQCAAKEVSCLGSSLESLHDSDGESSDQDIRVSEDEKDCKESIVETKQEVRELRNPLSTYLKSHAECNSGYVTPPFLSPGITRRLKAEAISVTTKS